MSSHWLRWSRFHVLRLARAQPLLVVLSALLLVFALLAFAFYGAQIQREASLRQENNALARRLLQVPVAAVAQDGAAVDLPAFEPVKLVDAINRLAIDSKLPLDEVSFVLEDNPSQHYLRYRATLTVSSRYPAIRRFMEALQTEQPQVSFDAVNCVREDITTTEPTCDLGLSAFYRKRLHG